MDEKIEKEAYLNYLKKRMNERNVIMSKNNLFISIHQE